ncbi:MAG: class I SAM-dependent methyltransferase [Cyclobacteriaceae bacterium]|nr:class I SAM-dependent methyltransferase [Cyclobacteriaceae bacterium]
MNQESHWDSIASNYNKEIFDVFKSDRKKILPRYFKKHSNEGSSAMDFGCGTGKAFPYVAPLFKNILALDISAECLRIARQTPYDNISFKRMDLAKRNIRLPTVDFVFSCNVIMLPEISKNEIMMKNVQKSLRANGTALLVVPSFDSVLYASWRMIDWYRKEGVTPEKIPSSELSYFKGNKRDILQGIVHIDGVRTKHYSEAELEVLIDRAGLKITAMEKLSYDWNTEFSDPPAWMGEPYPWDWLIECKKLQ